MSSNDPAVTDSQLYKVLFENERVRVLEYRDQPGDQTHAHRHPDSVMYTLSSFRRRVSAGGQQADIELPAGQVRWLGAQEHSGHNTGTTETHTLFIELKEPSPSVTTDSPLGPSTS
jgi:quercetin dioxygenase-like cupin family protein